MKKKIMITSIFYIAIFLISAFFVHSAPAVNPDTPPAPVLQNNQMIINEIDSEAKTTRQYFSTELQRQNTYFISEFTKRADFYEEQYQIILNNAVLKLGTLWAGVFIVVVSISSLLNYWAEKRRYLVLKNALKKDLVGEIKKEYVMLPDKEINILNDYLVKEKQKQKGEKVGLFKRLFGKKKQIIEKHNTIPTTEIQPNAEIKNVALESLIDKMKRGEAKS